MLHDVSFIMLRFARVTIWASCLGSVALAKGLSVGAAVVDVTPQRLPVLVNGSMTARTVDTINTSVNVRAIVVGDDERRIALAVVDSCMVPQVLLDDAKQRIANRVGIAADRIMISATHTHTAPSAFGALGTPADPNYVPFLREKLVEAISRAAERLQPARVGWGSTPAPEFTALRRWVRRPDRIVADPFGNPTVRANMHAAKNRDDVTGPSGPEDPELSMIAFRSVDGKPIALLANFSMHYFQDRPISADYFGLFCETMQRRISPDAPGDVVVALSHGCSGDIWRRDYSKWSGEDRHTIETYAQGLSDLAYEAYQSIKYEDAAEIEMAESRLPMRYRVPDRQRLEWSQRIFDGLDGNLPKTKEEIYAREQVLLHQLQHTKVVLQAIRIGSYGIVTTPTETYALTGLKFKRQSPLEQTMVIELANGADGYIPPPEQHHLGGYNTWAARSAGLEVQAEPKIVAEGLRLLEEVSDKPRRIAEESFGPASDSIRRLKPIAYWRMAEMHGAVAVDASGHDRHAIYEPGVVFYLEGPDAEFTRPDQQNRCAHFAGGRMKWRSQALENEYTLVLSFWNGMPGDARETTGWLFSRDFDGGTSSAGHHLGIGGTATRPGRLVFQQGTRSEPLMGDTRIERWTWNRVGLVRTNDRLKVFLNDQVSPEVETEMQPSDTTSPSFFIGGRSDNDSNFEGRIDEVAVFDRALADDEINRLLAN